jgi:hypothetical protein
MAFELAGVKDHDGDLPSLGVTLIKVISGINRDHFLPELIALLIAGQTRADLANLRADLNCGVRVCHEVVEPGRV